MKTLITTLALSFTISFAFSQDLVPSVLLEYTVTGPQYGAAVAYESQKEWGAGVFYQVGTKQKDDTFVKDEFYGAQIQVPLVRTDRISFFTALRGGLVNQQFLVVVPGLETRINIGRRVAIAFGMSLRKNYPSVSSKLAFRLF